jgi:hypothetical protein
MLDTVIGDEAALATHTSVSVLCEVVAGGKREEGRGFRVQGLGFRAQGLEGCGRG